MTALQPGPLQGSVRPVLPGAPSGQVGPHLDAERAVCALADGPAQRRGPGGAAVYQPGRACQARLGHRVTLRVLPRATPADQA
eukprot:2265969-Alexandrium_andersonii.AAC.1